VLEISAKDPVAALCERRIFRFLMENAAARNAAGQLTVVPSVIDRRYIDG
jgi:hypothetical protein